MHGPAAGTEMAAQYRLGYVQHGGSLAGAELEHLAQQHRRLLLRRQRSADAAEAERDVLGNLVAVLGITLDRGQVGEVVG